LSCLLSQPFLEHQPHFAIKRREAQVVTEATLMVKVGHFARRWSQNEHGRQSKLTTKMVQHPHGHRRVVTAEKPPTQPENAELECKTVLHVIATTAPHLGQVFRA